MEPTYFGEIYDSDGSVYSVFILDLNPTLKGMEISYDVFVITHGNEPVLRKQIVVDDFDELEGKILEAIKEEYTNEY